MWQNNMLKFYLENDVDKAVDYGSDLVGDLEGLLTKTDMVDLKFTLGVRIFKCLNYAI